MKNRHYAHDTSKHPILLFISIALFAYAHVFGTRDEARIPIGHFPIGYETPINCFDDIARLFPRKPEEISRRCDHIITYADKTINDLLVVPNNKRTYANTVYAFDRAVEALRQEHDLLDAIVFTHPDKKMRETAHKTSNRLLDRRVEYHQDARLNRALVSYNKTGKTREIISPEEAFFLAKALASYDRNGLNLPAYKQRKIGKLKKNIARSEKDFDKNINDDIKKIDVPLSELGGLTPAFINTLESRTQKCVTLYMLPVTGPIVTRILNNCTCEKTRKAIWHAFANRAYPTNEKILKNLITLRDRLARELGYAHYADYEISNEMAGSVRAVSCFLHDMYERSEQKVREETAHYLDNMPAGVSPTADNKINPWDWAFVETAYRKKQYNLDARLIAEYFPLDRTIKSLIPVFETFFGVTITYTQPKNLWHPDVRALEVRTSGAHDAGRLFGYILLDLFPRPNKYTHACCTQLVTHLKNKIGGDRAGVSLIIANFPGATHEQPALMQHDHLTTLLHELGHAFHDIMRSTTVAGMTVPDGSINGMKIDFVEMPSQLLEECAWQPEILRTISEHYKTGAPLSEESIAKITELRNFDAGALIRRLLTGSYISLECFTHGEKKNIRAICKAAHERCRPYIAYAPDDRSYASFGHLAGYGARYYGYLWSKVYARDIFEYIKTRGFPTCGPQYVACILAPYAGKPPRELLHEFLGREPNSNAFFNDLIPEQPQNTCS